MDREDAQRQKLDAQTKAERILSRNGPRIDKFLELAYRKVATPDEYGDEHPAALDEEIRRFLGKLAESEGDVQLRAEINRFSRTTTFIFESFQPIAYGIAQALRVRFDAYYRDRKARAAAFDGDAVGRMAGTEFELYLSDLLRSAGITDVSSTAVTGDQGGDLLFTYRSRRVVVQAKRYGGTVGNKAVQEALAARSYYGCDEAWVVTNSRFSSSARTLAKEVGVVLIEGPQLEDFRAFVGQHFAGREGTR
jgi:HJR/Mrr/RecB family endonuclease